MRALALIALFLLFGWLAAAEPVATDSLDDIRKAVAEGKAVLVDVREQGEWDAGHLAGAVLVPLSELSKDGAVVPASIPKDKPVYLYCRSGGRSLKAAGILQQLKYDARSLKQGYAELGKNGFTAVKPADAGK